MFQGGKAEDVPLVLGSGFMLPGFEDELTGVEQGAEATVNVEFPESYPNPDLAGKPATFAVTVKEIAEPKPLMLDDDLAKGQGFEDLDGLKSAVRERIAREYAQLSRTRVKRALLDHVAENYPFQVPAGMIDLEFEAIWKQLKEEMERTRVEFAAGQPEDKLKEEYRVIAKRRVRLGLVLSDIGQRNQLKVEQHELNAVNHGAGTPLPRAGAEGVRFLSQQSFGLGAPACTSVRGQGSRFHSAAGERERAAGDVRGTDVRPGHGPGR